MEQEGIVIPSILHAFFHEDDKMAKPAFLLQEKPEQLTQEKVQKFERLQ